MSIRTKLVAAAGALALVAFSPAAAKAAVLPRPYAVGASQKNAYNVQCAQGADSGTAPVKLRVTRTTGGVTPSELGTTRGPTTQWVATWPNGSGSITMTSEGTFFGASPGATFPCPFNGASGGRLTIAVQSFLGSTPNGAAAHITIVLHRVGSVSGGIGAVTASHTPGLTTTVLGELFVKGPPSVAGENTGAAPVGGVQTGAGGTSHRGHDLLPLGAGLGGCAILAGLVAHRRRRTV